MAHPLHSKSRRPSRPVMSVFANLGRDLEIEARMIVAGLRAPLKRGLESMLRFGFRSDIMTTILDRPPGQSPGILSFRPDPAAGDERKPASSSEYVPAYPARRMPKRFLAARHGDE
ncbi:MAG TPA: hypothetical protein VFZ91_03090 [Allosphingosinicella sp.]